MNGDNETDGREGEGERKKNDTENGEDSTDSRVIGEKEETPTDVTIAEVTGKTAEIDIGDVESDIRLRTEIENIQSKSREDDNLEEVTNAEDAKVLRMVKVNVKGGGTDGDTVEAVNESSMQKKEGKEDEIDHDPNATEVGVLKESGGGGNDGDTVEAVHESSIENKEGKENEKDNDHIATEAGVLKKVEEEGMMETMSGMLL